MKKPLLYKVSPCVIGIVICAIAIIVGFSSGGYGLMLVIIFWPVLLILAVADVLIKLLIKERVLYIWIIEFVVVAILILWFRGYRL